jgi:hypothetical protein
MPSTEELAWAAGFFDGEGCVVFTNTGVVAKNGRKFKRMIASTCQVDYDTIKKFVDIIETGVLRGPFSKPNRKPIYRWYCYDSNVDRFIEKLRPYLTLKYKQYLEKKELQTEYKKQGTRKSYMEELE